MSDLTRASTVGPTTHNFDLARSYLGRSVRYLGRPFRGKPSIPLMNGYSTTPPKCWAKARRRSGGRFWPRKKITKWSSQARRVAATVLSSMSAERSIFGDLGPERAGDRTDLKRTIGH